MSIRLVKIKISGNRGAERVALNANRSRDCIVAKHTVFKNFSDLVATPRRYRPSIYMGGKSKQQKRELIFLVAEYDSYMAASGDSRRVFKGDWEIV